MENRVLSASLQTQRLFFEKIAKDLQITDYSNWGRISKKSIRVLGGGNVLSKYRNSLFRMFSQIFPEVQWKREWFNGINIHEKGYWRKHQHQRLFIDSLAKVMNVQSHSEWGSVHVRTVKQNGGTGLIKLFGGSLFKSLKSAYPEIEWKSEWFPTVPKYERKFFHSVSNQRRFLDEIAVQYNFTNARDWRRVTSTLIKKQGGNLLLKRYNGSLSLALSSVFKEIDWKNNFNCIHPPVNKITHLFL